MSRIPATNEREEADNVRAKLCGVIATLHPNSPLVEDYADRLIRLRALLPVPHTPWSVLERAIRREPRLCYRTPEDVMDKFDALATGLGLSGNEAVALLLAWPKSLLLDPQGLLANATAHAETLGLDAPGLRRVLLRQGDVLLLSPDRLVRWCAAIESGLGISTARLRATVKLWPKLLGQRPETLIANTHGLAAELEVAHAALMARIAGCGHLWNRTPPTVGANMREAAARLDVPFAALVAGALRWPVLLGLLPDNFARKRELIDAIGAQLGERDVIAAVVARCPIVFTASEAKLRDRLQLATIGVGPKTTVGLVQVRQNQVRALLAAHGLTSHLGSK